MAAPLGRSGLRGGVPVRNRRRMSGARASRRQAPRGWVDRLPARCLARAAALAALALLAGCAKTEPTSPPSPMAAAPATRTPARPQRIVSLNLCTDQMLLQMVDHRRIRALTFLASDERSSALAAQARRLPATLGVAEEVIAMQPDLVLAGTFSTRATIAILRRLGYTVVDFAPEDSFGGIIGNIRKMAAAVGEPARGEAMVRQIESELARTPAPPATRPVYANYGANGYTSGDGALITSVANAAGFDTLGQRLGLAGTQPVALEQMLLTPPDLIDLGEDYAGSALATELYGHPVLRRLMREQATVNLPGKYTACGSPLTLEAVRVLVAARQDLS